jgi:hypothetical protein
MIVGEDFGLSKGVLKKTHSGFESGTDADMPLIS